MENECNKTVFVIGALNLDVCGVPENGFRLRDSNLGRVTLTAGGVGHNIARHLSRAGVQAELITALGNDDTAGLLASHCAREGVRLTHALRTPHASSTYMCLHDADGDMIAAVNDMTALNTLTPERLAPLLPLLNASPLVVLDANPPAETLDFLAQHVTAPLLLDPVSGFKAERVRHCIGRFTAIKPNLLEASLLSGESEPAGAADWFLAQGVRQVFISLGSKGVYYADAHSRGHLPAVAMHATNCTGAGDAMVSGIALSMLDGATAKKAAQNAVASVTRHLLEQGGTLI